MVVTGFLCCVRYTEEIRIKTHCMHWSITLVNNYAPRYFNVFVSMNESTRIVVTRDGIGCLIMSCLVCLVWTTLFFHLDLALLTSLEWTSNSGYSCLNIEIKIQSINILHNLLNGTWGITNFGTGHLRNYTGKQQAVLKGTVFPRKFWNLLDFKNLDEKSDI